MTFDIDSTEYRWHGEFEATPQNRLKGRPEPKLTFETLHQGEHVLAEREASQMSIEGKSIGITPLSSQSMVKALADNAPFSAIHDGFQKILKHEFHQNIALPVDDYDWLKTTFHSIDDIRHSYLTTQEKLLLACQNIPTAFDELKQDFIAVFPQIEDVIVETVKQGTVSQPNLEVVINLKVGGVKKWIQQPQISAGMLKTLMLLGELYLSPDGTVLLIDEFENSLGVNCIDIIDDLVTPSKNLQLIITSHHPYIINNIPMDEWKIVTRQGGTVTVKEAKDFKQLGRSSHERFMQLIQLDEIKHGVAE
ncbi:AAA family ATPase [Anaerolineales bacterium HSG24]|nr:AAA family ATPase [Anaerolineales bacterium HSG24]